MSNKTNFRDLKTTQAIVFLLIPVILYFGNGCKLEKSISDYANYIPMLFAFLLTLAGSVFMYDGYVERSRWYNLIPAIGLFGVVLFINTKYPILHYGFAGVFFLGSVFNMIYFSLKRYKLVMILVSLGLLFGMAGHFFFNWYSLYFAEWIGMIPISITLYFRIINK
jgi:hypothetical protein